MLVETKIAEKDFKAVKDDIIGATKSESVLFKHLGEKDKKDFEIHIKM